MAVIRFNENFKTERNKWVKEHEKWENEWKDIIGKVVWVHLKIENSMLSMIIDLQNIGLGSEERKEVEKLNFLTAARTCFLMSYIDYTFYEEIKGFNTERNNVVHKIFKKPKKTENFSIKKFLLNGERIHRKILDTHFSLEDEKARELLGGKSEAGLPTLCGTPEEQLEQLKGYSGYGIKEMREEIRKKIKEAKSKN